MRTSTRTPARRLLTLSATAAALLAALIPGAPAAQAAETFQTYGTDVGVRAEPTTASTRVGNLAGPTTISVDCQITGETVDAPGGTSSTWAHVPDLGGYVSVAYITYPEPTLPASVPTCGEPPPPPPPPSAGAVTLAELEAIYPGRISDPATVDAGLPGLNAEMEAAQINTPARKAAFLATLLNESELQYSADQGGGGYTGRGFIQLTGPDNYGSAGEYFGIDLLGSPELALSIEYSAPISTWYWTVARDINPLADALDMGAVDDAIGYAEDPDEDVERCDDFKAALVYYNGGVLPEGINCIRPTNAAQATSDGVAQEPPV